MYIALPIKRTNMATLETLLKSVETKVQMLEFTNEDVKQIMQDKHVPTMERRVKTLQDKINEVHELKTKVQEARIGKGDDIHDIREWSNKIDGGIRKYEASVLELSTVIKDLQKAESEQAKREEEDLAAKLRHQKFEEEMKFEEAKLQKKLNFEKKALDGSKKLEKETKLHTKLPKLVITRFKGIQTDWLRFWNQFVSGIDETDIGQVTKFSYLKELLDPKVRACIDGLPFTTEGYERAKNILKSKYGKDSEVINAYVQNIIGLQTISGSQPHKIHAFYETLLTSVQSLETLGKLTEVSGYVRMTLDKLEGIRSDLVRTDDSWQEWKFPELIEALRKWTERNPLKRDQEVEKPNQRWPSRSRNFQTRQQEQKPRSCVYCDDSGHRSTECKKVATVADRRKILGEKQRCFNCTGARHKAADCRSQTVCLRCKKKHHTSICDTQPVQQQQMLVAKGEGKVIYPVVVVKAGGIKCRALLDTGAGSSYASAALLERLSSKSDRREFRKIEMMMQTSNKMIDIHKLDVSDVKESFALKTEVTKVDRSHLLSLPNPKYKETIEQFKHLKGVTMEDTDEKEELPIHLILGASDYAKIKTATQPRVGNTGEPVGEFTKFGWTIMSPGTDDDLTKMLFTQSSMHDYQKLCDLDVLGIKEPLKEQQPIYEDFKEQLSQSEEGWYETGLLWKPRVDHLPSNERGSRARLTKLVQRLERKPDLLKQYQEIIEDQERQGIIEKAPQESEQKIFYIPHKPVVKESAETTKVRIVYDASARETDESPSLNDCLETGPPLQNLIWDILVRNRFKPIALSADLKQAFLQVRIREEDRDVLRFHWIDDESPSGVAVYRFTRALFGLNQSPFLLGGTLDYHLTSLEKDFPDEVNEIKESLYVDDIISGGTTVNEVEVLKESAIEIFDRAHFQLHKWHSSEKSLEEPVESDPQSEQSFAKQQLGVRSEETKLLGMKWNKSTDQLAVTFPTKPKVDTKRTVLSQLASVFDPLGLVAPVTLSGKFIYRDVCDSHVPWDQEVPEPLISKWHAWNASLPEQIEVPRSLAMHQEDIHSIDLHAFGDTSGQGTAAAVYAVVHQTQGVTQGLVTAKARLAKKELSIPRLELVSGQMAASLLDNVKKVLKRFPVQDCYGWLDSTVALHWINGEGSYKQFVRNRVKQIKEKGYINWRHVGTKDNPADIGSRGCGGDYIPKKWLNGPPWLSNPSDWPPEITTKATDETNAELKRDQRAVLNCALEDHADAMDCVLEKFSYWKAMRISAWIARYLFNLKSVSTKRRRGALTTEEIQSQVKWWIKKEQMRYENTDQMEEDKLRLNLQENESGLLECKGRIQGEYPIYIPPTSKLAEKIVMHEHVRTLHGGVGMTMAAVRNAYWIPRLRQLTKKVRRNCNGCKRFQVTPFPRPPTGNLPKDRTTGTRPFQVIGVDYAGPILYKNRSGTQSKAYLLLFACSLTRAVHLELLPNLSTEEFMRILKQVIARRGKPEKIYSDNAKTFVAAAKRIQKISKSEQVNDFLAKNDITWQFNLSKAPWWGGQYERLIGIVKQSLYKVTGKSNLRWKELAEVVLDVEISLNNRPLTYVEDDVELSVLTPNLMITGESCVLPDEESDSTEEEEMKRRARHVLRSKQAVWKRWTGEYMKALRERHDLNHKEKKKTPALGEVVLIKNDSRNRGKWNIGVITKLFKGRDGVVRGARMRSRKTTIDRPIQDLYPLELSTESTKEDNREESKNLNPDAREFRPRRAAAELARQKINIWMNDEDDDN